MDKPFLSIDEQIALLQSRGMVTDNRTEAVLMREGYYSVVNGYKNPFIDWAATEEAGDDRYKQGTTFADLYALYSFDRELKSLTFRYLIPLPRRNSTPSYISFSSFWRGT